MYIYVYTYTYIYMYIYISNVYTYIYINIYIYVNIYALPLPRPGSPTILKLTCQDCCTNQSTLERKRAQTDRERECCNVLLLLCGYSHAQS